VYEWTKGWRNPVAGDGNSSFGLSAGNCTPNLTLDFRPAKASQSRFSQTACHRYLQHGTSLDVLYRVNTTLHAATHLAKIQSQRLGRIVLLLSVHSHEAIGVFVPAKSVLMAFRHSQCRL
jgi:hypothetical protein